MTQQIINIGAAPEDGTGDQLRTSFDKCNQNFTELYTSDAGKQPLDADLTAIAALTGTDTIYYRSGNVSWSPVTFSGLTFSGGVLTASASGAPIDSPTFTGDPKAPTPATADSDTSIATTAFVKAQAYAPLASPVFTGTPTAPTPSVGDNSPALATTAYVKAQGNVGSSGTPTNNQLAQWINATTIKGVAPETAGATRVLLSTISVVGLNSVQYAFPTGWDMIEFEGMLFPSTPVGRVGIRVSNDNGATFPGAANSYWNAGFQSWSNTGPAQSGPFSGGDTMIPLTGSNLGDSGGNQFCMFEARVYSPTVAGSSFGRPWRVHSSYYDSLNIERIMNTALFFTSWAPLTHVQIFHSGPANFLAGSWLRVYGIK